MYTKMYVNTPLYRTYCSLFPLQRCYNGIYVVSCAISLSDCRLASAHRLRIPDLYIYIEVSRKFLMNIPYSSIFLR
jgi:hypothetical protein